MSIDCSQLSLEVLDTFAANNAMSEPLEVRFPVKTFTPRTIPNEMQCETLYPFLEPELSKISESTLNSAIAQTRRLAKDFSNNFLQRTNWSKYYEFSSNSEKGPDAMKISQQHQNKNVYLLRHIQGQDSTINRQLFETASSVYMADSEWFDEKSYVLLEKYFPQIQEEVEGLNNTQDEVSEKIKAEIPAWLNCKETIRQMANKQEKDLVNYARLCLAFTQLSSMGRQHDFIEKLGVVESSTISIEQEDAKFIKEAMQIARYGL